MVDRVVYVGSTTAGPRPPARRRGGAVADHQPGDRSGLAGRHARRRHAARPPALPDASARPSRTDGLAPRVDLHGWSDEHERSGRRAGAADPAALQPATPARAHADAARRRRTRRHHAGRARRRRRACDSSTTCCCRTTSPSTTTAVPRLHPGGAGDGGGAVRRRRRRLVVLRRELAGGRCRRRRRERRPRLAAVARRPARRRRRLLRVAAARRATSAASPSPVTCGAGATRGQDARRGRARRRRTRRCVNAAALLDLDVVEVAGDERDRLTADALRPRRSTAAASCAVVASAGATNTGADRRPRRRRRGCAPSAARGSTSTPPTAAAPCACPSCGARFAGIEHADSLVIDPHKWLFAPLDCAAVLYRDPAAAARTHRQSAGLPRGLR